MLHSAENVSAHSWLVLQQLRGLTQLSHNLNGIVIRLVWCLLVEVVACIAQQVSAFFYKPLAPVRELVVHKVQRELQQTIPETEIWPCCCILKSQEEDSTALGTGHRPEASAVCSVGAW
jgi:hypothetical protein